jgi:hypothetical protein
MEPRFRWIVVNTKYVPKCALCIYSSIYQECNPLEI